MLRAALAALCVLAVAPGAHADALLDFEGFVDGTVLSTEQIDLPGDPAGSERGVEWGIEPDWPNGEFVLRPRVVVPGGVTPSSGTMVLQPPRTGGCPPRLVSPSLCTGHLTGRFPLAKQTVSLRVGLPPNSTPQPMTLRLLDVNGDLLASDTEMAVAGSMATVLSVTLPGRSAVYMTVEGAVGDVGPSFYADDVAFDTPAEPPPADFGLKVGVIGIPQVDLIPGDEATVPIALTRVNRSAGPVALSIAGLPAGVTASFAPATLVGRSGVASVLTLRAAGNAGDVSLRNLVVRATPLDPSAGATQRAATVRLSVETLKIYDLQVTGMEITQATQYPRIPEPNPFDPAAAVPYTGVQLVAGRRTVVRVFANNARAVPLGGVGGFVVLRAFGSDGRELPGSPLNPVSGPSALPSNGALGVSDATRRSNAEAFTFVLPDVPGGATGRGVWTTNATRLRAEITGPGDSPSFFRRTVLECGEPRCRANNAFTVKDISWARMPILGIWPIQVTGPQYGPPAAPWRVFEKVPLVTPMTVRVPYSYKVTISDEGLDYGDEDEWKAELKSRVEDWADGFFLDGELPVATGGLITGVKFGSDVFRTDDNEQPVVFVRSNLARPLTSVAHEIGHALGRPHAGQNCDGTRPGDDQEGESWLPDDQGRLQGYGMDVSTVGFAPPTILATDTSTTWFDLMSYCAPNSPETGVWVSPRGWDAIVGRYRFGSLPLTIATRATEEKLRLSAVVGAGVSRVAVVRRGPARVFTGAPSALRAVARDAGGALLAQTELYGDAGDEGDFQLVLRGDLPLVDGIARIEIVGPGNLVRTAIERTATPPTVRIVAPTASTRVRRGRPLVVRWQSTDADGDALRATVDYSVDGGRNWRPLGLAPSTGSLTLAPRLLQGSSRARVRVRVRDTLDEVAALSAVFRVDGNPPVARIDAPRAGASHRADAPLVVSGEGFDDGGRALTGRRLTWLANGRVVGRGTTTTLRGLPPGRVRLQLVARDARGRSGRASVTVRVRAVRPVFTRFTRPASVRRTARTVRLRVATNVASTLTVAGQRFRVGPTPRQIVVRIRPGRTRLVLPLRLASGGRTSSATVTIARR